ncbi:MAG: excinuclease ABC subunit UvrA, partial [Armatimonadetes bacterium]|nr:excinuclease ABC subunit UvrA [Armatimonadota bacterium]
MPEARIVIQGAREHNLQNVSLELPRDRLIVFTGVSGPGKSSLAFDTIYAEGQRRYIESLSTGARQFVGQLHRPDVDRIEGLSPAIAIQQKAGDSNPRSTVATVTEIYDYLRVFWARLGPIECCGHPVGRQTSSEIVERLLDLPDRSRVQLLAPLARQRRGEFRDVFDDARRAGFVRVRVDGEIHDLAAAPELDRNRRHDVEIVVDRVVIKPDIRNRLADSVELALTHGQGTIVANVVPADQDTGGEDIFFSREMACPICGTSYVDPSPQLFSFNSVQGMCTACQGLGVRTALDPELLVPDPARSINQGAVGPFRMPATLRLRHVLDGLARHHGIDLDRPWEQLDPAQRDLVLYGSPDRIKFTYVSGRGARYDYWGGYHGVLGYFQHFAHEHAGATENRNLGMYFRPVTCPDCHGLRLRPEALLVKFGGLNLSELTGRTIAAAAEFFDGIHLEGRRALIGDDLVREIRGRLNFLTDVGLHYLTLDRPAPSLSGGEGQRIRLASQIGAGLVGVTYVLDEPSIGL